MTFDLQGLGPVSRTMNTTFKSCYLNPLVSFIRDRCVLGRGSFRRRISFSLFLAMYFVKINKTNSRKLISISTAVIQNDWTGIVGYVHPYACFTVAAIPQLPCGSLHFSHIANVYPTWGPHREHIIPRRTPQAQCLLAWGYTRQNAVPTETPI